MRGLWKSVAVPNVMYGVDATVYTNAEWRKLEVIQNRVGRIGLGGNKYVAVEEIRGEMGWSLFKEGGAKAILNFKIRIELMYNNR